jgi:tetratricopeptide (TPR) repeat protein
MANTKEAIDRLRVADNYLTHIADKIPDEPEEAKQQFLATVAAATKHIEAARAADPTAVLVTTDEKTEEKYVESVDELAGRAMYWEGFARARWSSYPADIRQGIDVLLKARKFSPLYHKIYSELGYAHMRLGERSDAHVCLKEAIRLNPQDFDAQKMLDGVGDLHLLPVEKPPVTQMNPVWWPWIVTAVVFLVMLFTGLTKQDTTAAILFPIFLLSFGFSIWFSWNLR